MYLNIIWIKIFCFEYIIEKVKCLLFYIYIFNFITKFQFIFAMLICVLNFLLGNGNKFNFNTELSSVIHVRNQNQRIVSGSTLHGWYLEFQYIIKNIFSF